MNDTPDKAACPVLTVDDLERWLEDKGFAESRRGYGHVTGDDLAATLLRTFTIARRDNTEQPVPCGACDGSGQVPGMVMLDERHGAGWGRVRCRDCDGTGQANTDCSGSA